MEEDRFSVQMRGDLAYAGSKEVATMRDATVEIDEQDAVRLEAAVVSARAAMDAAMARGNQARMDAAEAVYDAAVSALLAFEAEGESMSPVVRQEGPLSLSMALSQDPWQERQLDAAEMESRLAAWEMLCRFTFDGGRITNPWQAFKNFLAVVRRVSPSHLGNISQTELAVILVETKASPSAREKKVVEGLMKKFKMLGYHLLGGTKTDEARRRCAIAQRGNRNRRKAKGGKKG